MQNPFFSKSLKQSLSCTVFQSFLALLYAIARWFVVLSTHREDLGKEV